MASCPTAWTTLASARSTQSRQTPPPATGSVSSHRVSSPGTADRTHNGRHLARSRPHANAHVSSGDAAGYGHQVCSAKHMGGLRVSAHEAAMHDRREVRLRGVAGEPHRNDSAFCCCSLLRNLMTSSPEEVFLRTRRSTSRFSHTISVSTALISISCSVSLTPKPYFPVSCVRRHSLHCVIADWNILYCLAGHCGVGHSFEMRENRGTMLRSSVEKHEAQAYRATAEGPVPYRTQSCSQFSGVCGWCEPSVRMNSRCWCRVSNIGCGVHCLQLLMEKEHMLRVRFVAPLEEAPVMQARGCSIARPGRLALEGWPWKGGSRACRPSSSSGAEEAHL